LAGRYGPTASPRIASLLGFRLKQLAQNAAPVMLGLLGLLAAVLLWRRLAGALSAPLATPAMFAFGATLTALAALLRLAWHGGNRGGSHRTAQSASILSSARSGMLVDCGVSGLVVVVAASISLPKSTVTGLLLLWAPPLLGECVWWTAALGGFRRQRIGRSGWLGRLGHQGIAPADQTARSASIAAVSEQALAQQAVSQPVVSEQAVSEQTVQHIIRTRSADGKEKLTGWLRLDFAPGQRTAVAHVAFCPPLDGQPVLTVRQRSGPACRVKTAQVVPFGVRVELRLVQEYAQPQQVVLELEAHC